MIASPCCPAAWAMIPALVGAPLPGRAASGPDGQARFGEVCASRHGVDLGVEVDTAMPAFGDVRTDEAIEAILALIASTGSEAIRQAHEDRQ